MLLEIVKGRGVEFSSFREREVFVVRVGTGFFLFFWFLWLFGVLWFVVFGEELIEVHAGITSLQVGNADWQELFPVVVLVKRFCMLFFKEDANSFVLIHAKN